MSSSKSIPRKDADFNVWQNVIANAANDNMTNWLLDSDWFEGRFFPARNAWVDAWAAYENPTTRTTLITFAKNKVRKNYEKLLSILVSNLRVNTRVIDEERMALGIVIPDRKPSPAPVPTTYPMVTIDTSVIRRLGIHFRDSATNSLAKPKGVHGAEIKWVVTDEKPTIEALLHSSFDTRTPYIFEFDDTQRGKTVWMCLRWENTRGEKGPWGDMISAIIPYSNSF